MGQGGCVECEWWWGLGPLEAGREARIAAEGGRGSESRGVTKKSKTKANPHSSSVFVFADAEPCVGGAAFPSTVRNTNPLASRCDPRGWAWPQPSWSRAWLRWRHGHQPTTPPRGPCPPPTLSQRALWVTNFVGGGFFRPPPPLPPLWPLTPRTAVTLVAAAAAVALAAGGGMGGGGILVPLFLIVLRAPTREAVALSNVTIMAGSLAAFLVNARRRHPTLNRPLIDWDVMLLMEPTTIVGAVVGGYLNRVSPPWATTAALALLLVAITAQLTVRATGLWKAETRDGRAEGEALLDGGDDAVTAPPRPPHDPHAEPRLLPPAKAAALAALTLAVVASDEVKTRLTACGSLAYWVAAGAVIPAALAVAATARARILREAAAAGPHADTPASTAAGDAPLHWTPRTATLFPAISTLAGVVAGAFGVGGGIVKGPILLELGVAPTVAAATSAAMIVFTSAAACAVCKSVSGRCGAIMGARCL